jgi:wyosine [tRNA(Phe)-imidazoG37] synthetase (radical SAM superfamily)
MAHTFGPVPSRRLGLSLGIDIVPMKTCTLSCRYCQIGTAPETMVERREYVSSDDVVRDVGAALEHGPRPDWLTFSGSGEPTLNLMIGDIIRRCKALADIPVCVITNGTLLSDPTVRADIADADAVMPSLDAARQETFERICRPHRSLAVADIIEGLVAFRAGYSGRIWLEILFVKGINDGPDDVAALKAAVNRIGPDTVQLNTVARPPAESDAMPVDRDWLEHVCDMFGSRAEIIAPARAGSTALRAADSDAVLEYLARRPGTLDDLASALAMDPDDVERTLNKLAAAGTVETGEHEGRTFWSMVRNSDA